MEPATVSQLRTLDSMPAFDVEIPSELWDLVDGRNTGNETPLVRDDWYSLAQEERMLRDLYQDTDAMPEPKFAIMDDDELDAFESLVQEANEFPMQEANARGIPDSELGKFFDADFGFKPDGSLQPVFSETNEIDFDAYIRANENVQTTTLMEDLGLRAGRVRKPRGDRRV